MTPTGLSRRRGFTLIELLAVMGIMALLIAISVGAYFAAAGSQKKSNTEATVSAIYSLLEDKRKAVVSAALREPIPASIQTTFAGGDTERAKSVWVYLRLKQEFPTSHAEANTPISLMIGGVPTVVLRPRTVFSEVQNAGTGIEQSAACLYVALMKSGAAGKVGSEDGLQNKVMTTPAGQAFRDEWSRPIAFLRLSYSDELDAQYAALPPAGRGNPDTYDPKGRLNDPAWAGSLPSFWAAVTASHIPYTGLPPTYQNRYSVFAVVSGGPDSTDEDAATAFGANPFGTTDYEANNIVSYRLTATAGKRGD